MASLTTPPAQTDFLIRGSDYLAANPGFKMIGRKDEIGSVMDVLLRKSAGNNLVLHGNNGVGLSTLLLGLEAAKTDPATPFDLVSKSFFYLDTDKLFAHGGADGITKAFQQAMETLEASENAVLVISDTKAFLDGVENSGAHEIVNRLMHAVRTDSSLQLIFESSNDQVGRLLDTHADLQKNFSTLEVQEPGHDDLRAIVESLAQEIGNAYGVTVSKDAVDSVIELTEKYPGLSLGMAQPKRSAIILEGAMTAYIRQAHAKPAGMQEMEDTMAAIDSGKLPPDLADKTTDELAALRLETEQNMEQLSSEWASRQKELQDLVAMQMQGERAIQELDTAIADQKAKDADKKEFRTAFKEAATPEAQAQVKQDYKTKYGEELEVGMKEDVTLNKFAAIGGSAEVAAFDGERKKYVAELTANKARYEELTAGINAGLQLTDTHVLGEFSRLSGVPAAKLQQDEKEKLLKLSDTMKQRVFGQDEPVEALATAVQRAKTGLKKPNKPIGSFIFLGPSGVGKTELAKALAEALFGDEAALNIYNMSEYMEKNASAVLIGAPPGYEGHAEGGLLTNNMRQKPYCVNVFDEAEKAHKDVFDLFLQIVDEGKLRDRRGMEASFANAINILTSNVGARFFLDESLTFDEAKEKAIDALWNGDPEDPRANDEGRGGGFRPEFLNRFTGIFCFNRLGQVEILRIADKNIKQINSWIAERGLQIEMSDEDKQQMCDSTSKGGQYDPKNGARGVQNYIENNITTAVAQTLLGEQDAAGVVKVEYDEKAPEKEKVKTTFIPKNATTAPAAAPAAPTPPSP